MKSLLILFMFIAWIHSSRAAAESILDSHKIERMNCLVHDFERVSPENIAQHIFVRPWQSCQSTSGFLVERRSDIFYLLAVRDLPKEALVLRTLYATSNLEADSYVQAFSLIDGKLSKLPVVESRMAAFHIENLPPEAFVLVRTMSLGNHAMLIKQPVELLNAKNYGKHNRWDDIITGLIAGSILIMIIYNLGTILLAHNPKLIYYLLYTIFVSYWFLFVNGFFNVNAVNVELWFFSIPLTFAALNLFILELVDAKVVYPRLFRATMGAVGFLFATFALSYYGSSPFVIAFHVASVTLSIIGIWILCLAAWEGNRPAIFATAGYAVMGLGWALTFVDSAIGLTPLAVWILPLAIALEIMIFSFAMGQKIRLSEMKAMNESDHAFNQLAKVFYPHQISLIRSGTQLEGTMPTGQGTGCVIAFDIIGSSQLNDASSTSAIREIFAACYEEMMKGYDGAHMRAKAYRIKEMGDGFLCSIGFPFQGGRGTLEQQAVELAEAFVAIVERINKKSVLREPIACAIGVASGGITGFYPNSGAKEYDLYGRAIVLATRYENMRKHIFADGVKLGNVIIVQNQVMHAVSSDLRSQYRRLDLTMTKLKVRDDAEATELHVRVYNNEEMIKDGSHALKRVK